MTQQSVKNREDRSTKIEHSKFEGNINTSFAEVNTREQSQIMETPTITSYKYPEQDD